MQDCILGPSIKGKSRHLIASILVRCFDCRSSSWVNVWDLGQNCEWDGEEFARVFLLESVFGV